MDDAVDGAANGVAGGGGDDESGHQELALYSVGDKLKAARGERNLTLDDVAKETRIPIRHLVSIEKSEFSKMPGSTYTVGFTRSYAKMLGLNADKLIQQLRDEMIDAGHGRGNMSPQDYEPTDPSSVPPKILAWTAAIIGLLIVAGYFAWRSAAFENPAAVAPATETAGLAAQEQPLSDAAPVQQKTANIDSGGQVVITAIGTVWLKIYDADNKRLFEAEMKPGDSYDVPPGANEPMIVTGRPDKIKITVAGKEIPPLGDGSRTIADVGVSAAALAARASEAAGPRAAAKVEPRAEQ